MSRFSTMLAAALAVIIGGLYVADRGLRAGYGGQAEIDAAETARTLETMLALEAEALGAARSVSSARDPAQAAADAASRIASRPGVEAVLIATGGRTPATAGAEAGAMAGVASEAARFARRIVRVEPGGARSRAVLAVPLGADAVAVARYDMAGLMAAAVRRDALRRSALVLRVGDDTLAAFGAPVGRGAAASAPVEVGAPRWRLEVRHGVNQYDLRLFLWALGALAVALVIFAIVRERRHARQVAERAEELERLYLELRRSNKMKTDILANVSHELRTPLNAVVGFVELLREGVYGELSARQVAPVDRIAASAVHLRHLVDQVLDVARLSAGRVDVHKEPLNLRLFVLDVASELEALVHERGLTLSITIGASVPPVETDPAHLRQILVNLLGNAVKYTPAGSVSVRARVVDPRSRAVPDDAALLEAAPSPIQRWVALQVVDTGVGIAPADQQRIFEEFEQVDAGARNDSARRGTGLGLTISRKLALVLGGDITVESDVGRGSTFTVWLPVADTGHDDDGGGQRLPAGRPASAVSA